MIAYLLFFVALAFATQEVAEITVPTLSAGSKFGLGIAAYEDLVIVGAPGDSSITNVSSSGSAYLYNCSTPDACHLTLNLTSPNPHANDSYGVKVGASQSLVAVGADQAGGNRGAVYVYQCLTATNCTLGSVLTATDGAVGDRYGGDVFVWNNWVLVGAFGRLNSTGSAYLYNCTNFLNCTLAATLSPKDGKPGSEFGYSVGMSDWLVVIGAESGGNGTGAAYAYNCQGNTNTTSGNSTQGNSTANTITCTQIAELVPPATGNNNHTVNATSPTNSTAKATYFGSMLYVSGDIVYIGAYGEQNSTGAVYVYNCSSKSICLWVSTLTPANISIGGEFGSYIAADGTKVVIGAPNDESGKGSAFVYDCANAAKCNQTDFLVASDGLKGDQFGFGTAINSETIIVTAPGKNQTKGGMYTYWADGELA